MTTSALLTSDTKPTSYSSADDNSGNNTDNAANANAKDSEKRIVHPSVSGPSATGTENELQSLSITGTPDGDEQKASTNSNSNININMHEAEGNGLLGLNVGYFEWQNINVCIEGKQILNDMNGRVGKGQLLGILGGSGAGKTTLLNAISGRILTKTPGMIGKMCCIPKCKSTGTQVTGSVAWNNEEFVIGSDDSIKFVSAYVMQSDIMCATATGEEALQFSALLKLPASEVSKEEREQLVDNVLNSLKINECKTTMIGNDAIRGMSGGEKKRTSVAVELVTNPDLIFLDEPTSGLDSFTALKTLQILKGLAKQGKQVIATIHQPSSEIFAMLDALCVLAKGHVVYYGPSNKIVTYFQSLPAPNDDEFKYHCPQFSNPADFVINHVQQDSEFFIEQWKNNQSAFSGCDLNFEKYAKLKPKPNKSSGLCLQLMALMIREFKTLARDPRPSKIRFVQTVVFALLVGVLYWDLPHTQEGMRDRFGAIFFLTVNSSMAGLIGTIIVFPEQRLLFERECNNNMYTTTTYLVAKSIVQLPEQALFALLYEVIIYWMIGMDSAFWELYIILFLCIVTTGSVGMLVGCFANNAAEAMQVMPITFIPFLLFANFLVSLDQIPSFIRWIQWIDPFKYMVESLCITEFAGISYDLEIDKEGETVGFPSGDAFLNSLDIDSAQSQLIFDWYMLAVLLVGYRVITWLVLVRRNGF